MDNVVQENFLTLEGVTILQENGWSGRKSVVIRGGIIEEIRECGSVSGKAVEADGLMLLPGIIDLHGDGFEYHMAPRAGVNYPVDMAVMANDIALVSSGITTFFYSITDGFEPGMRSRETVRKILGSLDEWRDEMRAGICIHIRHEQANIHDHDELVAWIENGRIDLLSLNNHLPPEGNEKAFNRYLSGFKRRVAGDPEEAIQMVRDYQHRLPEGARQVEELAALANEYGICLASHDDMSDEDVTKSLSLGVQIAEFPMTIDLAHQFREKNVHVLMGAPNAVRGESHVSAVGARDAIKAGAVDVLCSDYHYPSLYRAPFLLNDLNILEFPESWALVSANPADAAGFGQCKGKIKEGMDADMLLISGMSGFSSDLRGVIRDGKFVLSSGFNLK